VTQYPGPPISSPDPTWRPAVVEAVDPPRTLPHQDHAAMDAAERTAARFTLLVGGIAALTLALLALSRLLL
jgi:hypothetical protein